MSKVRVAELYDALDKRESRGNLLSPSLQSPEDRKKRIAELSIIHLASMAPDEWVAIQDSVKAIREGGEASRVDNVKREQEAAARAEAVVKVGDAKAEAPASDFGVF
jgi:hypothetical protein